MNWRLLAIFAAPVLIADAAAPAPPAMSVGFWVSACSDSEGVEATNIGKQDDPEPELNKAALNLCQQDTRGRTPSEAVSYTIVYRNIHNTSQYGKVIQWTIRCGRQPVPARQSGTATDAC
jgi:hypothetical protein